MGKSNVTTASADILSNSGAVLPMMDDAKADAIAAVAMTAEDRAAQFELAKVEFEAYGELAAQGAGVTTAMALRFFELRLAGIASPDDAKALYTPFALGWNRAKRPDMAEMDEKSAASGLSIFATFGLHYAVAVQSEVGAQYERIMRLRDKVEDKSTTIGSNYSCYVAFNRRVNALAQSDSIVAAIALLRDTDKGDEWLRGIILKPDANGKSEFEKAERAAKDVAKLAKSGKFGLDADWLALASYMEGEVTRLKAKAERVAADNAKWELLQRAAPTVQ